MYYNNNDCTTTTGTTTTGTTTTGTTTTGTTTTSKSKDRTDDVPAFNFSELEHSISRILETTQNIFRVIKGLGDLEEHEPHSIYSYVSDLIGNLYGTMSVIYGDTAAFEFCEYIRSAMISIYLLRTSFDSQFDELQVVYDELDAIEELIDKNKEED